jgi:tRNA(Ile)-lysidine synthase
VSEFWRRIGIGGAGFAVLAAAIAAGPLGAARILADSHVDHGLHPDSAQWSAHCRRLAERLGMPCEIVAVDARPAAGESPEAAARAARYDALAARLQPREVLLIFCPEPRSMRSRRSL